MTMNSKSHPSCVSTLDNVAALNSMAGLPALVAQLQQQGIACLFGFGSQQDFKNSFCRQIKQRCFAGIYRRGVPGEQDTTSIFGSVYSQARSVAVAFDGESTQNALDMGNLVRQTGSTFDPWATIEAAAAMIRKPEPISITPMANFAGADGFKLRLARAIQP